MLIVHCIFCFILNSKSFSYLLSFVFIHFHSLYHSSFVIIRCHSSHSLSFVVPLVVIRCHSVYHSSVFFIIDEETLFQKQSSRGVLGKKCSEDMQQIYRRVPMPKCDFSEVACNFIKITLRHGCSPVNLLHIFRTPFPRNTSEWLLMYLSCLT